MLKMQMDKTKFNLMCFSTYFVKQYNSKHKLTTHKHTIKAFSHYSKLAQGYEQTHTPLTQLATSQSYL